MKTLIGLIFTFSLYAPFYQMSGGCSSLNGKFEKDSGHTFSGSVGSECDYEVRVIDETLNPHVSLGPFNGTLDPDCSQPSRPSDRCYNYSNSGAFYRGQVRKAACRPGYVGGGCRAECVRDSNPSGAPSMSNQLLGCVTTTTTTLPPATVPPTSSVTTTLAAGGPGVCGPANGGSFPNQASLAGLYCAPGSSRQGTSWTGSGWTWNCVRDTSVCSDPLKTRTVG